MTNRTFSGRRLAIAGALSLTLAASLGAFAGSPAVAAGTSAHGAPVIRQAPAHPPATAESNNVCTVDGGNPALGSNSSDRGLVWTDAHPTGVVTVWLPGLNAKPCAARRVLGGAALAGRIVAAIQHGDAVPSGALPCPYSDGAAVKVYLTYAGGGDQYAAVTLNGCREVIAPGRTARWARNPINRQLARVAPSAWQQYFADIPPTHGQPVIRTAPAHAPAATQTDGSCNVSGAQPGGSTVGADNLVWVRSQPTGAVALWLPGRNAKHCVARRTVIDSARAGKLAAALRHSKAFPRGVFCPLDDGSSARLYFTYANGHDEYAGDELTGCRTLSAPGRSARETSTAFHDALAPVAPAAWRSYFAY